MSSDKWDDDVALLADLGRALQQDSDVPESVRDAGRAAFAWRTIDAELIELTRRELTGEPVRSDGGTEHLAFDGPGLRVELERDGEVLRGQLVPPGPGRVEVIGGAGNTSPVTVSDDGYFVVRGLPAVSVRLRVSAAGAEFRTPWFGPDLAGPEPDPT